VLDRGNVRCADVGDLLAWFEDADEPLTAVADLDER
jgi:hypothetical protein